MIVTDEIRADSLYFDPRSRKTIELLCDEIDRLRAKPKPQGKTSPVDVKVAVDWCGNVAVGEDQFEFLLEPRAYYTITADLPVPEETTVEAEVD